MGFWADNFGGGNSFTESLANAFTPNDGASYVGGTLTYDSGENAGQAVPVNSSGGYGSDDDGNAVYSGSANSDSTNAPVSSDGTNEKYNTEDTVKGKAPSGMMEVLGFASPVGVIGKISGWANGLNPKEDDFEDVAGRRVYTSADGMTYSYNFLGLPYEVTVQDGKVVDSLSIEGADGLTGYERMAQEARDRGDNDEADAIMQEAANNAQDEATGDGTGELNIENILNMAKEAGLVASNADIQAMIDDPAGYLAGKGMSLADLVKNNGVLLDPNAEGTTIEGNYGLEGDGTIDTTTVENVETIAGVNPTATETYTADTSVDNILNNSNATANAATGTVSNDALLDPNGNQIDITGAATGVNEDGTVSVVGEALNDYASINTSMIIDTSTVSGKLLAQKLADAGETYVDSKATLLGQMKIISEEFKDSNGNPIIPQWAQGMAREIQRSMAFSGVTGTAATAAMSNAIMEATLGVAEKEASFFQTLTIKNLDNKQQSLINKMNILSNFEIANLDARQAALVQNAKHFMEMDLQNLSNEQQAEILNTQLMVDAIFNDQAAINAARLFGAEQSNDMAMFYDEILFQTQRYNAEMLNNMARFNVGEINDAAEFNATMADSRERFNRNMQYNIDVYNADWRQRIAEANSEMMYDAYAADVKNAADLNQEGLNRIWDRVDNLLDYFFKGASTEAELDARVLMAEISAAANSGGSSNGLWSAIGSIGAAAITKWSDERLKDNIKFNGVINGIRTYTWDWNDEAKRIGADQYPSFGVIAQEIQKTHPEAVVEAPNGYLMVNYGMI